MNTYHFVEATELPQNRHHFHYLPIVDLHRLQNVTENQKI